MIEADEGIHKFCKFLCTEVHPNVAATYST